MKIIIFYFITFISSSFLHSQGQSPLEPTIKSPSIKTDKEPDLMDYIDSNWNQKPGKESGTSDRDGDGVPDAEDLCPGLAGPVSNKGCPVNGVVTNVLVAASKIIIPYKRAGSELSETNYLYKDINGKPISIDLSGKTDDYGMDGYIIALISFRGEYGVVKYEEDNTSSASGNSAVYKTSILLRGYTKIYDRAGNLAMATRKDSATGQIVTGILDFDKQKFITVEDLKTDTKNGIARLLADGYKVQLATMKSPTLVQIKAMKGSTSRNGLISAKDYRTVVLPPIYSYIWDQNAEGIKVSDSLSGNGKIDEGGKWICKIDPNDVYSWNNSSDKVLKEKEADGKYVFIDKKSGKQITEMRFDEASYYQSGYVTVAKDKLHFVLDLKGKEYLKSESFSNLTNLDSGLFIGTKLDGLKYLIDINGNYLTKKGAVELSRLPHDKLLLRYKGNNDWILQTGGIEKSIGVPGYTYIDGVLRGSGLLFFERRSGGGLSEYIVINELGDIKFRKEAEFKFQITRVPVMNCFVIKFLNNSGYYQLQTYLNAAGETFSEN